MKKLIYCIVLLLLCPFTVFAQQLEWIDLSKNPPTIELDYKAQLFSIYVEGQYKGDIEHAVHSGNVVSLFRNHIIRYNAHHMNKPVDWLSVQTTGNIQRESPYIGDVIFHVKLNETSHSRSFLFEAFYLGHPSMLEVVQHGRYEVQEYEFSSGQRYLRPSGSVTLELSGSNERVHYDLYRDSVLYATSEGTGGKLSFEVHDAGLYHVEGWNEEERRRMLGEVCVNRYNTDYSFRVDSIFTGASDDSCNVVMNYMDGFGRPLQCIEISGSPLSGYDLVTPFRYDGWLSTGYAYQAYAASSEQGELYADAYSASNWQNVYGESEAAYAFAQTDYEASPLNRVVKRMGEGRAWHTQGKGVTTAYGLNAADEVRCYEVADDGTLAQLGYYAAGTLQTVRTTDEDGHTSITYTDNQDREVLSVQTDGSTRLETYKVYDDRGLLRWVLSPEASAQLDSTTDSDVLERLAYNYAYDARKRMTLKRLPGCAPIYMVYDSRDRMVLSQDGEERADNPNRWSYSQYDSQGRVVETGELLLSQAQSHEELQRAASKSENYLPSGTRNALQRTFYDSYPSGCSPFQATEGYSESYNAYPVGQATCVQSREFITDEWETVTTYYDDYARPIQAITAKGQTKTSRVDTEYDFLGNVVKLRETQSDGMSLETVNTYDSRSRLLSSVTTKNKTEQAVMKYGYDAVGRLVEKRYGNTVEKLGYNVRGWLTSKESAAFKIQLRYEQPEGGATASYNGNICEWEWSHGTNPILMYGFAYDSFGRLASANQKQATGDGWAGLAANYVEKGITYDRNGNIRTLQRTAAGNLVDDLIYGYSGNRLVSLSEQVRTSQSGDVYQPGNTASGMYEYDSNGNLTKDIRKSLEYKYNRLNLLEEVWKDGEMKAQYNYLSDGTKVSVRDGSGKNGYDYVGSVVYKVVDGRREFDRAVVGDVHFTNEGVRYALTDQLGSVRALIDEDGNVVQQNDYYPFGAKVTREDYVNSDDNRFLFSGKESQELLDLNAYDFGARMYDASLGRWNTVDLLGEKYTNLSPYNYCVNNPLVYVDPNGLDWFWHSPDGISAPEWIWHEGSTYNTGIVDQNGNPFVLIGHESVVVFDGFYNEKLGDNDNLFGTGAILANVTVYGPNGKFDIKHYKGFTMSSDFVRYGAIANGEYDVYYRNPGKSGVLKSNWAVNDTNPVDCLFGKNPSPINPYSSTQKNGIYIHRSNNDGFAGGNVSTGCLLIAPSRYVNGVLEPGWTEFNQQLKGVKKFRLILKRTYKNENNSN